METTGNKKILVLIRECRDPRPPALFSSAGGTSISDRGQRLIPNPADLSALEAAFRLAGDMRAETVVLAIGPESLEDTLRLALAMGADRAIRVHDNLLESDDAALQARILRRIFQILAPSMVCTGYRRQDLGIDPVPALAAALHGHSAIHSVVSADLQDNGVIILRKTDRGGRQRVRSPLPCTLLFEEAEPSLYPSIDSILRSLEAPIEVWGRAEIGISSEKNMAFQEYTQGGEYTLPRPDPYRVVTPDPRLPAFARILALLDGGIKARQGRMHFITAEETADALLAVISREQGQISGEKR